MLDVISRRRDSRCEQMSLGTLAAGLLFRCGRAQICQASWRGLSRAGRTGRLWGPLGLVLEVARLRCTVCGVFVERPGRA